MFKIAVCDDEEIITLELEKIILDYNKTSLEDIEVEVFTSGEDLCKALKQDMEVDLIFLDIELKQINGVEVGRWIREEMENETLQIVYISSKDSYYLELFDVRPMHFLQKPLVPEKVIADILKAMELSNKLVHSFSYKQGRNICKKPLKDIIFFEAANRQVKMVTLDEEIFFYGSINEVYSDLKKHQFFFIHKSFLVNYIHVVEFKPKEIKLSNSMVLPIGQQRRREVMELQIKLHKGEE